MTNLDKAPRTAITLDDLDHEVFVGQEGVDSAEDDVLVPFYKRIASLDVVLQPSRFNHYDDLSDHDHEVLVDLETDLTKFTQSLLSFDVAAGNRSEEQQKTLLDGLCGIQQIGDHLAQTGAHVEGIDMREAVLSGAEQAALTKLQEMGGALSEDDKEVISFGLVPILSKSEDEVLVTAAVSALSNDQLRKNLIDEFVLRKASSMWQLCAIPEGLRDGLKWEAQDSRVRRRQQVAALQTFTSRFGFDFRQTYRMYKGWAEVQAAYVNDQDEQTQLRVDRFQTNMANMLYLSRIDPSLPKRLHDKLGIRNFHRYDPDKLAGQVEPGFRPDGIVVSATYDHNAAFDLLPEHSRFLGDNLLFMEAANSVELIRRMVYMRKMNIPVKHVYMAMHGNELAVDLGPLPHELDMLTLETVKASAGIRRLVKRGLIDKDCEILMWTCNAGWRGGIAQKLRSQMGIASVQAAKFATTGVEYIDPETGQAYFGTENGETAVAGRVFRPRQ